MAIWLHISVWQRVTWRRQSVTWSAVMRHTLWGAAEAARASARLQLGRTCTTYVMLTWSAVALQRFASAEHHHLNWGYWRGGPSSCHKSCLQVEGFMFCLFNNTTAFISCSYVWAVGQNSPPTGRDRRVGSTHWRFWRPEAAPLSWAESPPARSPSPAWPAQEAPRRTWEHTAEFTCAPLALNQS